MWLSSWCTCRGAWWPCIAFAVCVCVFVVFVFSSPMPGFLLLWYCCVALVSLPCVDEQTLQYRNQLWSDIVFLFAWPCISHPLGIAVVSCLSFMGCVCVYSCHYFLLLLYHRSLYYSLYVLILHTCIGQNVGEKLKQACKWLLRHLEDIKQSKFNPPKEEKITKKPVGCISRSQSPFTLLLPQSASAKQRAVGL